MKKKSILTKICALLSVFTIGAATGCSALEGVLGGLTGGNSSVQSEISENSEKPETPTTSEKPETPEQPGTSETPEQPEQPGTSETPEQPEQPGTSETPETPEEPEIAVTLNLPTEDVVPYQSTIYDYLTAGAGAKVKDYHQQMDTQATPVTISWSFSAKGARKFLVEYATKADYSDAIAVETTASKRSIEVYNLYKDTTYYVRVTALGKDNVVLYNIAEGTFKTTDVGPRFMMVDGVCNVRDLGGYKTNNGKTLVQGIAYRGGHLKPAGGYTNEVTEEGLAYMSEVMGIKSEIDFRTSQEAGFDGGSFIPGANLTYITINSYNNTFQYDDEYRAFFSILADENNYPVHMHCTGGADRTGSAVYLLHTMLGVSEEECLQGYELTSFSIYGLRDTQYTGAEYKGYWDAFMEKLNSYAGNTKQEKVETWMKQIGVTQAQIDKIKAIFYGEIQIEGKSFIPNEDEMPTIPVAERKSVNKQYSDMVAAWAVQKKKD